MECVRALEMQFLIATLWIEGLLDKLEKNNRVSSFLLVRTPPQPNRVFCLLQPLPHQSV